MKSSAVRTWFPWSTSGRRCLIGAGLTVLLVGCGGSSAAPPTGVTGAWKGTLLQPNGPVYKQFTYSKDLRETGSA